MFLNNIIIAEREHYEVGILCKKKDNTNYSWSVLCKSNDLTNIKEKLCNDYLDFFKENQIEGEFLRKIKNYDGELQTMLESLFEKQNIVTKDNLSNFLIKEFFRINKKEWKKWVLIVS